MRTRFLLATFFAALSAAFVFPVAHVAGLRLGGKGGTIVWDGSGDVATMNTLLPKEEALENVTSGVVGVPTNLVIRLIMRVGIRQVPPAAPDSSDDGDGVLGLEALKLLLTARLPCDSCLPLCPAIPDLAKVNFDTCDNGPDPTNLVASADVEGLIAGPVYADGAEFTLTPSGFNGLKNAIRNKGLLAGLRLGLSIVTSDDYRENGKVDEYATFQLIPLTAGDAQSAPTAGVLLQNDNGQLSDWLLSANQFIDHTTLTKVPPNWKLVGSGDIDRDGDADLFWHEQNEGWVAVWRMDGTRMLSGDYITPSRVPDTNWKLRTIGDLDGNGYPDLVWQNVLDERVIIWFMNGTTLLRDMPMQPAMLDRNWHFVAAGDTNGDGRADLFLQHQLSGKVGLWIMNGRVNVSGGFLTPDQVPIEWKIRGAKDLNGDGRPDLLLQNATTGALARWLMNGSSRVEEILLTPAEVGHPRWRLAAVR